MTKQRSGTWQAQCGACVFKGWSCALGVRGIEGKELYPTNRVAVDQFAGGWAAQPVLDPVGGGCADVAMTVGIDRDIGVLAEPDRVAKEQQFQVSLDGKVEPACPVRHGVGVQSGRGVQACADFLVPVAERCRIKSRHNPEHGCQLLHAWTVGKSLDTHPANFDLIYGRWGDGASNSDRRAISLLHFENEDGPGVMVIDAKDRPIATSSLVSKALTRDEVIGTDLAKHVFAIFDAVITQDTRLTQTYPAGLFSPAIYEVFGLPSLATVMPRGDTSALQTG